MVQADVYWPAYQSTRKAHYAAIFGTGLLARAGHVKATARDW